MREREREMILHSFDSGYRKGKKKCNSEANFPLTTSKAGRL